MRRKSGKSKETLRNKIEANRGHLQTQYYQKRTEIEILRDKIFLLEREMESIRFAVEAIDSKYYGVKKEKAKARGKR